MLLCSCIIGHLCWPVCHGSKSVIICYHLCGIEIIKGCVHLQGFLDIRWAKWKRVLLTRSVAIVPCVIIAILARNSLDYLDNYINIEQSLLVKYCRIQHFQTIPFTILWTHCSCLSPFCHCYMPRPIEMWWDSSKTPCELTLNSVA